MKKFVALITLLTFLFVLTACSKEEENSTQKTFTSSIATQTDKEETEVESNEKPAPEIFEESSKEAIDVASTESQTSNKKDKSTGWTDLAKVDSVDDMEDLITEEFEGTVEKLTKEWEELSSSITTFDEYCENVDKVEAFYNKINTTAEKMSVRMYEYSLRYAEIIVDSDDSTDDMYDEFDEIYDCVYDGAGEILYDDIYDGILEDMYDTLYDDVLDDSDDADSYSEWSDVHSDEYDFWSDTRSDVYDFWSDARSDIYDFWSDVRGDLWDDDLVKTEKTIKDFKEDVEKLSE